MKFNNTLPTIVAALIGVTALSLSPTAAHAQAAAPKAEKAMLSADDVLRLLDKNGDGVIDREEAKADPVVDKNFTAINKSGSGKISRDELDAFMVKK
jgi:EF hand